MRQRNDSDAMLHASAADPPFAVAPGEEIDYPIPVVGLTVLPEKPEGKSAKAAQAGGAK
ncbi:MAG TPA: hypothetical protein VIY48_17585 [Candidatus Paceibacterota bacterium]